MGGSKISNAEWGMVIGAMALIDLTQFILDFFLIGIVVNRIIDLCVGALLPFYFKMRGVKMNSKKLFAFIGSFLLELVGIESLDALPLWTADAVMTMIWDKEDKREAEKAAEKQKADEEDAQIVDINSRRQQRIEREARRAA